MSKTSQQKETILISEKYSPEERQAIAAEVIDFIIKRTREDGLDKNNRAFKGYSQAYKDSFDFKLAGKSGSSVDLTLSGDMLDALNLIQDTKGKITIGYEAGNDINGKVEGNRLGTYGKDYQVGPKRDFLGITKKDLSTILKKYPLRDEEKRNQRVEELLAGETIAQDVLKRVLFDLEDEE